MRTRARACDRPRIGLLCNRPQLLTTRSKRITSLGITSPRLVQTGQVPGFESDAVGDLALAMAQRDRARETAARAARNDAVFREANERIDQFARSVQAGRDDAPLPFLCECGDVTCTEIVRITRSEYQALRQAPARFATVPGHEGGEDWARVVVENDRYAIVEKLGVAAEVAAELDPRAGGR
jgi:hypothetical protein